MITNDVSEFRIFNRFYTAYIGILNKRFMNSKYSLPQSRVLHAVYTQEGITPTEITSMLNMDKSYLSRILIQFERKKLITRKVSSSDGRAVNLYITKNGKRDFELIDEASNKQIEKLLLQLSEEERQMVIDSMSRIKKTLSKYRL
jgi:DNA-binding MarR family transcriptional regulator